MPEFQEKLKKKMDEFAHFVYRITRKFPKEELYGMVSQMRRAALSSILNYIEGFARQKRLIQLNFLETSYGSLKESKYLLYFSFKENLLNEEEYKRGAEMTEEIGAMLWTEMKFLKRKFHK